MDVIIDVVTDPEGGFIWNPNKLFFRVEGSDILTKKTKVYFELFDSTPFNAEIYIELEHVRRGRLWFDTQLIQDASNDGQLNEVVIAGILSFFKMKQKTQINEPTTSEPG